MAVELSVKLKDEETTLKKDFLLYNPFTFTVDDSAIKGCIAQAMAEFHGNKEDMDMIITAKMVIK